MGISVGPNIIEDGLVLALDAADVFLPVNKNLLTYTNDLSNAVWGKIRCQITASATIAPDGTNTAFAMNITDATGLVRLSQSPISSSIAGGPYTFSVYVKQNTSTAQLLDLGIYNPPTTAGTEPSYDILNNFAITGGGGSSISRVVTSVGNGWYRVATTATIVNNSTWYLFFDIEAGTGTKVNGQGIYLWGPQFEYGTVATEYQPVNITNRIWPNLVNQSTSGSLINNPTFNSTNRGSIVFDGVNDYVLCSNISSSINQNITISSWVNFTIFDGIGFSIIQIPVEQPTADATYLYIYRNSFWDNGQLSFLCTYVKTDNTIATRQHYSSTGYFKSNTWYNIVAMYDSTGRSKFYANGLLIVNTAPDAQFSRWVNVIGTPYFQYILNGRSSGLQIYNKALTDSEIQQNYNAQKSRFNL